MKSVNNYGWQRCLILRQFKTKKIPTKKIFSKPLFLPIIPLFLHKNIIIKKEYEKEVERDKKTALYVKLGKSLPRDTMGFAAGKPGLPEESEKLLQTKQ